MTSGYVGFSILIINMYVFRSNTLTPKTPDHRIHNIYLIIFLFINASTTRIEYFS